MDTDNELCILDNNSIAINNPHKVDVMTLFRVGFCVSIKGGGITNIKRTESIGDIPVDTTL